MQRTIPLVVAVLLATLAVAPAAAAGDFNEPSQQQRYVVGGDGTVVCDAPVLKPQVGGVCFELTGREGEVDLAIHDRGQTNLRRTWHTVEPTSVRDDVEDAVDPVLHDVLTTARQTYYELADETGIGGERLVHDTTEKVHDEFHHTTFGFTAAVYQVRDDAGNVLAERAFCGQTIIQQVPTDATEIRVLLDGPVFGAVFSASPLEHPCNTTNSMATAGTVFLNTEVDP